MSSLKKQRNKIDGWLVLNKPVGIGSTKALAIAKRYYNAKKAGHAGTLDPLACGVLPIAFGEATKTINYCMDATKEYQFTVKWGEATSTDDMEGEVVATSDKIPNEEEITNILPEFIGEISQIPPAYSAIKVDGRRAYDLARAGEEVELKSRVVNILELELLGADTFRVKCGKGTYVRSLARDIAEKLGTKAHVIELIRTKVGSFCINNAILLEKLEDSVYKADSSDLLLPVEQVLDDIPVLVFNSEDAIAIRQGKRVEPSETLEEDTVVLVKEESGLVGLCRIVDGLVKPVRVFNL